MTLRASRASVLTSIVLTIAVVSVFATFRNQGPQSTVGRYFESIRNSDSRAEGNLLLQHVSNPSADHLRAQVRALDADPGRVEIRRAFVLGRKAVVDAEFIRPDYGHYVVRFILAKPVLRWKVDAKSTWDYLNQVP